MARPLRIEYPDAVYHVINRGEEGERIFPGPKYFRAFLEGATEASERFNVQILAYCLLGNEYHLLLKTPEGNLSRFMRQVNGLYTQKFQLLRHEAGSVFRTRYKSVLLQPEKYLLDVSRYIHNLPKKSRTNPSAYQWSSLAAYSNKLKAPDWLETREVLRYMKKGARPNARYAAYVSEGADKELLNFYNKLNLPSILGDAAFTRRLRARKNPTQARGKSKGAQARLRPSIGKVVTAVSKHFKVSEKSIFRAARGPGSKNIPRWIAMYLCQELTGATLQEIAKRFGLKRYGTVSTTIGKLKKEFAQVPASKTVVTKLKTRLSS